MAITTYLIRMLPFTLFKKQLENKKVKSFLHFVPYACLTTMTVPAVFYATSSVISAGSAFFVAIVFAYYKKSLPCVAAVACITVFIVELVIK